MELLRSLQFVPGNRPDMLEKARTFNADVLIADLEDSVPPAEKIAARQLVHQMAPDLSGCGQKVMVRVNSLDTGLTASELEAVVGPHLYSVSLGKVQSPWHVEECDRLLSALEASLGMKVGQVRIIPWIESAMAVLRAMEIAGASPRVVALAFGAEDYTNDMGIRRTDEGGELQVPRALVAMAAKAMGIAALDTPYVRFRDAEGLRREATASVELGYVGKFSIHPAQLDIINEVFSPKEEDVEDARRVVQAWEKAQAEGRGAVEMEGKMVDVPVVKRALRLLSLVREMPKRK